jgi:hypothetical protein
MPPGAAAEEIAGETIEQLFEPGQRGIRPRFAV